MVNVQADSNLGNLWSRARGFLEYRKSNLDRLAGKQILGLACLTRCVKMTGWLIRSCLVVIGSDAGQNGAGMKISLRCGSASMGSQRPRPPATEHTCRKTKHRKTS